jgi:hypothetical protein
METDHRVRPLHLRAASGLMRAGDWLPVADRCGYSLKQG